MGFPNVKLAFESLDSYGWWWAIDNVAVTGTANANSFTWTTNVTGLYNESSATTAYTNAPTPNVWAQPTSSQTYTAISTTSNGCTVNSTVVVTVTQPPTTSTNGGNITACKGTTSSALGGNTPTVGTGAWTCTAAPGGGSTGDITFTSATTGNTTAIVAGSAVAGNYTLTWTISNAPCAASASPLTLPVHAPPTTATHGGNNTACQGTTSSALCGNTTEVGTGAWACTAAPGAGSL